ncbi:hypothetical protein [Lactobacillus kalixensis]|uniref:hypothetical protein n=1 Tax=Lactobacillus kalixensis TaxID=227944 RepID=UPI000709D674|nr:hypothetical protein [Lactobacillus kalixensis]
MNEGKENEIIAVWKLLFSFRKKYIIYIFLLATLQGVLPFATMLATQGLINSIQIGLSTGIIINMTESKLIKLVSVVYKSKN